MDLLANAIFFTPAARRVRAIEERQLTLQVTHVRLVGRELRAVDADLSSVLRGFTRILPVLGQSRRRRQRRQAKPDSETDRPHCDAVHSWLLCTRGLRRNQLPELPAYSRLTPGRKRNYCAEWPAVPRRASRSAWIIGSESGISVTGPYFFATVRILAALPTMTK